MIYVHQSEEEKGKNPKTVTMDPGHQSVSRGNHGLPCQPWAGAVRSPAHVRTWRSRTPTCTTARSNRCPWVHRITQRLQKPACRLIANQGKFAFPRKAIAAVVTNSNLEESCYPSKNISLEESNSPIKSNSCGDCCYPERGCIRSKAVFPAKAAIATKAAISPKAGSQAKEPTKRRMENGRKQ